MNLGRSPGVRTFRHASAVLEMLVAIAVLSLVLAFAARMSTLLIQQRKVTEANRVALETSNCLMAWAMAQPFDQLSAERWLAAAEELGIDTKPWQLEVESPVDRPDETDARVSSKRVSITMPRQEAVSARPVALVAWRYAVDAANSVGEGGE